MHIHKTTFCAYNESVLYSVQGSSAFTLNNESTFEKYFCFWKTYAYVQLIEKLYTAPDRSYSLLFLLITKWRMLQVARWHNSQR